MFLAGSPNDPCKFHTRVTLVYAGTYVEWLLFARVQRAYLLGGVERKNEQPLSQITDFTGDAARYWDACIMRVIRGWRDTQWYA